MAGRDRHKDIHDVLELGQERDGHLADAHLTEQKIRDFTGNFTYRFNEGVSQQAVSDMVDTLKAWDSISPEAPFQVVLNSGGGSVFAGLEAGDFLESLQDRHEVTVLASGYAGSMAGVLVQYASPGRRLIGRNSYLHLHEASSAWWGKASELMDNALLSRRLTDQALQRYADRSGGRHTLESVRAMVVRQEIFLNAEEALSHRFVDGIV